MDKLIRLYNKTIGRFVTKELIIYGITGVATTVVNYISYYLCSRVLSVEKFESNLISWFVAVTFAYITNKLWVFCSKSSTVWEELIKIIKFFGARIVTLGIEAGGFLILVNLLGVYDLLTKAFLSIFVILVNYVFSKLYIFQGTKNTNETTCISDRNDLYDNKERSDAESPDDIRNIVDNTNVVDNTELVDIIQVEEA